MILHSFSVRADTRVSKGTRSLWFTVVWCHAAEWATKGPVRSVYDGSFGITGAGRGEIEGNIWKEHCTPPESPRSDLFWPPLLLLCWFHTFLPSPTLSSYWLIAFFVAYSGTLLCPSKVPLRTEGLWFTSTMTHFDGPQSGWPCTRTPASV